MTITQVANDWFNTAAYKITAIWFDDKTWARITYHKKRGRKLHRAWVLIKDLIIL